MNTENLRDELRTLGYDARIANGDCFDIHVAGAVHYLSAHEAESLRRTTLRHPVKFLAHAERRGLNYWYDFAAYELSVRSDIYEAGITEDGQQYTAEGYFIHARIKANGRCYRTGWWPGCRVEQTPEFPWFEDIRPEAQALAEARLRELLATPQDFDGAAVDWQPTYPVYASLAYEIEQSELTDEERSL